MKGLLTFVAAAGTAAAMATQPNFTTHEVFSAAPEVGPVFVADVNGDGVLDIVSASVDGVIRWHQPSSGSFTTHVITSDSFGTTSLFVADLDQDGDSDILATRVDGMRWLENDGEPLPSFTPHVVPLDLVAPSAAFAVDMDADGDTDVLVASELNGIIQWYENNGQSSPTFAPHDVAIRGSVWVFAIDLEGDGDMDVLSADMTDGAVRWHESDGMSPPGFTTHDVDGTAMFAYRVFGSDIDGDGDIDMVSASRNSGTIRWHESDGASPPAFATRVVTTTAGGVGSVFPVDVDIDGDMDLLSASATDGKVRWHENDGALPPNFIAHDIFSASGVSTVFAADFDADGDPDLVSTAEDEDTIYWHESDLRPLVMVRNLTDGSAHATIAAAIEAAFPNDLLLAPEAFFGLEPQIQFPSLNLFLQSELGIHQPWDGQYLLTDGAILATTPANYLRFGAATVPVVQSPHEIRLGGHVVVPSDAHAIMDTGSLLVDVLGAIEVENDAWASLVAPEGVRISGDLTLRAQSALDSSHDLTLAGDRGFRPHEVSTSDNATVCVYGVDLDGDSDNDMLTAISGAIRWHENDGQDPPAFTGHTVASGITGVHSVCGADIDGDGDTDVLSASWHDDTIRWYENDGTVPPTFAPHVIFADADGACCVIAADIDGDGDRDVVSASQYDFMIRWYENDGAMTPTFVPHVIFDDADTASSVFAADVDGDGDTDLLSASLFDDSIRWYENDGQRPPSFTVHEISATVSGAAAVLAEDLDADGDLDVIAASQVDDAIMWFENNDGKARAFTQHVISTDAPSVRSLFVADINNDKRVDVLSATWEDDAIRWYENVGESPVGWIAHDIFVGADGAASVFAIDVNGDRQADVVSASFRDDTIRWYESVTGSTTLMPEAVLVAQGSLTNCRPLQASNGYLEVFGPLYNMSTMILADTQIESHPVFENSGELYMSGESLVTPDFILEGVTVIEGRLRVYGGLHATAVATLVLPGADPILEVAAHFDVAIDDRERYDMRNASLCMLAGDGPSGVEVMSRDIGADINGLDRTIPGHYPLGGLLLEMPGVTVTLVDEHDNDGLGEGVREAMYVSRLVIGAGTTLHTQGYSVYFESITLEGGVDDAANLIRLLPPCPADWNGSGIVDTNDFLAYLNDFVAAMGGQPPQFADPDISVPYGVLNTADFVMFMSFFASGCS